MVLANAQKTMTAHPREYQHPALVHPFPDYPAPGTTIEVAPGIHWLSTPLPFRLRAINLYLLEERDGWTIIDCGYARPDVRAQWEAVWAGTLGGKPVTRLIVTHFHPDHIGNSAWIAERWQVRPTMTQGEWLTAHLALRDRDAEHREALYHFYRANGLDAEREQVLRAGIVPYSSGVELPASFNRLIDGDELTIGGRSWRVIVGGGHSPEHASLYCDDYDGCGVLIAGDQLLPEITTNVSVWPGEPDADALGHFLASQERFAEILRPDTLVLPAHRRPFRGVHARIEELRRHHRERLATLLGILEKGPLSAGELVPHLFAPGLDGHQTMFAMGEALAHLNYLLHRGKLARLVEGGRTRFRLAGPLPAPSI